MGMPSFSRITYSLLTGLLAVKACDGVAIVQDPNEALYPGMPRSALENVKVDYCLPLSGIAARLVQLANESVEIEGAHAIPEGIEIESKIAQMEGSNMESVEKLALWELPWNRLQKPLACPAKSLKTLGGVLNPVSFSQQFPKSRETRESPRLHLSRVSRHIMGAA
jgi:hypothetical protein